MEKSLEPQPLVSVVTPFHNTRDYLRECIESVLRQTYGNWEYVLVDNCSSDGSSEIAAEYASRFPDKIRLIATKSFLSQVQNYNFALTCISPESTYCKMVQADDWLFPDCLRAMVEVAETDARLGIVAAYELEGNKVTLDGLPYACSNLSGREVCRLYFLEHLYLFGTPTSLLLRSELVKARIPFYEERYAPFEDAHACFDLLRSWDFGFAHQVLTFTRRDNDSILSKFRAIGFMLFSRLAMVAVHGREYLSESEYVRCLKGAEFRYFRYLSKCALRGKDQDFWRIHRNGLASIGYPLNRLSLVKWMPRAVAEKIWESFWTWRDSSFSIGST